MVQAGQLAFVLVAAAGAVLADLLIRRSWSAPSVASLGPWARPVPEGPAGLVWRVARAAGLTLLLGGVISSPIDVVLLLGTFLLARPAADRLVGGRASGSGTLVAAIILGAAAAIALALTFAIVSTFNRAFPFSEFLLLVISICLAYGLGQFAAALLSGPRRPRLSALVVATLVASSVLFLTAAGSGIALADNCDGFTDCFRDAQAANYAAFGLGGLLMTFGFFIAADYAFGPRSPLRQPGGPLGPPSDFKYNPQYFHPFNNTQYSPPNPSVCGVKA
jgi:hypothetical protein